MMLLRVLVDCCRSRQDLALENLVLRHQLEVLRRQKPRPRLRNRDRILWVLLRRLWPEGWTRQLRMVQPETVIGWHRTGWRLYWTWRSGRRLGRPRLSPEVRELIPRMSRDNRLWGTERIRGELLKLAIAVSNRSIRRYRWRVPSGRGARPGERSFATRSRASGRRISSLYRRSASELCMCSFSSVTSVASWFSSTSPPAQLRPGSGGR